jgi:hypothetical protein
VIEREKERKKKREKSVKRGISDMTEIKVLKGQPN